MQTRLPASPWKSARFQNYWWSGDPEKDSWEWRILLSRKKDIAYGKFFNKKAGYVLKKWFPVFAKYRRNGYDFEALIGDELASFRAQKIMAALELDDEMRGLEMLSFELKEKAGFGKGGEKNFEGIMTELQMQTFLLMSDFRQKVNRKGQAYGWHIAAFETPETKWGYDYIAEGYKEDPERIRRVHDRAIRLLKKENRAEYIVLGYQGAQLRKLETKETEQKNRREKTEAVLREAEQRTGTTEIEKDSWIIPAAGQKNEDVIGPTSPKTGDQRNSILWIILAVVAAGGIIGAAIVYRKRREG